MRPRALLRPASRTGGRLIRKCRRPRGLSSVVESALHLAHVTAVEGRRRPTLARRSRRSLPAESGRTRCATQWRWSALKRRNEVERRGAVVAYIRATLVGHSVDGAWRMDHVRRGAFDEADRRLFPVARRARTGRGEICRGRSAMRVPACPVVTRMTSASYCSTSLILPSGGGAESVLHELRGSFSIPRRRSM